MKKFVAWMLLSLLFIITLINSWATSSSQLVFYGLVGRVNSLLDLQDFFVFAPVVMDVSTDKVIMVFMDQRRNKRGYLIDKYLVKNACVLSGKQKGKVLLATDITANVEVTIQRFMILPFYEGEEVAVKRGGMVFTFSEVDGLGIDMVVLFSEEASRLCESL